MKIIFLPSAANHLLWFRNYYTAVFPEGAAKAMQQIERLMELLEVNPYLGQPGKVEGTRRKPIPRTPFVLLYRVTQTQIEVLRLRDSRQGHDD